MDTYAYKKYVATKENVKEKLEKYGVAIIPNVLNEEECDAMYNGMWESIEHITQKINEPIPIPESKDGYIIPKHLKNPPVIPKTWVPIKKGDQSTWVGFEALYPLHHQLLQRYTLTHAQYYWDIRQNPKIVDIFAHFWQVKPEELLVSFDGLSLCLPPEITGKGWNTKHWLHTDLSYTNSKLECIQSWVTARDIEKGDATLTFLHKSHKYHKKFGKHHNITDKSDWYKLDEKELKYYLDKGCEQKSIYCPKGSLVLWDSRTVHCGQNPIKGRENPNIRSIVYLCYTPRKNATNASIKKKIKAFEELRTTNHNPHKPKLFATNARTYGGPLPNITPVDKPVLNELGKKLVGY